MIYFVYNALLYSISVIASPYFLYKLVLTKKHRTGLSQRGANESRALPLAAPVPIITLAISLLKFD